MKVKEKQSTDEDYSIDIGNDEYEENQFEVHSDGFIISDELKEEIESVISNSKKDFSFCVVDLNHNISFGYNPTSKYSCASSIKAPFSLYCYKQMETGESTLDTKKIYNVSFYSDGSGIMKNSNKSKYSMREILYNTIHYSDNIGYKMLYDEFGVDGYNDMLDKIGCTYLKLDKYSEWGFSCPREMALVWQEIYNYRDTEYGKIFFDDLLNAKYNFIKDAIPEYTVAHKSGFSKRGYNDNGIVFDEDTPYIISVMFPYPDDTDNHSLIFNKIVKLSNAVMQEYKQYSFNKQGDQKYYKINR